MQSILKMMSNATQIHLFSLAVAGKSLYVKTITSGNIVTRVELSLKPSNSQAKVSNRAASSLCKKFQDVIDGKACTIPHSSKGTEYQKLVWQEASSIPYGTTITYGELAKKMGMGSARSAGQALKANPLPLIIPCHRIIAAGGKIGGFSSGTCIKKLLLRHEYENCSIERQS